jgi:endogenous inhibitor of DNA gyrase (YacG/DUF329 family)
MQQQHRPFCSERCRLQDLTRWADGAYRAAADATADDDADAEQPESKHSTPDHG